MPKQSVPIMKICHTDIKAFYFQIVVNYWAKSTEEKTCYRLVYYHSLCLNDHRTCENNFLSWDKKFILRSWSTRIYTLQKVSTKWHSSIVENVKM